MHHHEAATCALGFLHPAAPRLFDIPHPLGGCRSGSGYDDEQGDKREKPQDIARRRATSTSVRELSSGEDLLRFT